MNKLARFFPANNRLGFGSALFLLWLVQLIVWGLVFAIPAYAFQTAENTETTSTAFPYFAITINDSTRVYSGPGDVHYATDELQKGESVEVHRHDPGGWCAIRPVPGSFSLVPSEAIDRSENGFGVVNSAGIQAWVGTRLGSVEQPLWQVKLRQDEQVKILGEANWPSPDGTTVTWYQIAPPDGEFRWVHRSDLKPADRARSVTSQSGVDHSDVAQPAGESAAFSILRTPEINSSADSNRSGFTYLSESEPVDPEPAIKTLVARPQNQTEHAGFENQRRFANVDGIDDSPPVPPSPRSRPSASVRQSAVAKVTRDAAAAPVESNDDLNFNFRPIESTPSDRPQPPPRVVSSPKPDFNTVAGGGAKSLPMVADTNPVQSKFAYELKEERDSLDSPSRQSAPVDGGAGGGGGVVQASFQSPATAPQEKKNTTSSGWKIARPRIQERQLPLGLVPPATRNAAIPVGSPPVEHADVGPIFSGQFGQPAERPQHRPSPVSQQRYASLGSDLDFREISPSPVLTENLSARLAEIEMQLTNEMLKRPNEWQIADLEIAVSQIYSQTENPVERLQAQRTMDKISKLKTIRNGYTKTFQATGDTFGTSVQSLSPGSTSKPSSLPPRGSSVVGTGIDGSVELGTRFDAYGWLTELVSEGSNNNPTYVLLNDAGKITHHVEGVPGLNVHRYVKSKVGINGRKGFNHVLKLDHVAATAITELQARRR